MKLIKNITLTTILSLSSLSAHNLWVNSFESFAHKPGHTTVSLGWGHTLPIDDIVNSPMARIGIEEYHIISPNGEKTNLEKPKRKLEEPSLKGGNFDLYKAEIGLQKVALKEDSQKGVYKIQAKSEPTFYTIFIDNKDRKRMKLKPIDELKNVKEIRMSLKYQAFATSYLTIGDKWETPKATNEGLEIIPKTDLSKVKVGDMVEFEVLFYGKPLSSGPQKAAYITADSTTFGQGEGFSLHANIKNGKAKFRVQSKGQWKVVCKSREKVTKDGKHKNLYGKTNTLTNATTLTFNVK